MDADENNPSSLRGRQNTAALKKYDTCASVFAMTGDAASMASFGAAMSLPVEASRGSNSMCTGIDECYSAI